MKQADTSPIIFEKFSYIFRMHAHLLIAWGHKNIEFSLNTDDEEEITGLLYRSIDNELCSGRLRWFSNYSVKNNAKLQLKIPPQNVHLIDAFPLESTSTHERDIDRPITIYHILLDCLPTPNTIFHRADIPNQAGETNG